MGEEPRGAASSAGRLGMFAGVFTPSVLTILGIILFLRLGYVTGEAGLLRALVIIALANAISVLTSFSLSAIATNFEVKGGGDYYLISRTLGPQFGGAIGIVLFLAQSVSIAFYAIGFGEAVAAMLPDGWGSPKGIAALAIAGTSVLAWLGSDWATRFQFAIMGVLCAAIGAFVAGAAGSWDSATLGRNWSGGGELPFWALFALFFPAVTGFTQGVSMSGELADPARSLPLGTFLAVGVSIVVYLGVAVLFAAAVPGSELRGDYGAMRRVAVAPWLIDAGVVSATLSSALASFLGAPRILQSLASDKLAPLLSFFAKTSGARGNPRRGVVLSGALAATTVAVGDLNWIAPIVSMFFLVSYGLLNYATYFEARAKSPSFRPSFRLFHQRLSLAGCIACIAAIVAINPTAGAIAFALLIGLHQFLGFTSGRARWADGSRSAAFQRVRGHLVAMAESEEHPRDWRPVVLAFSDDPGRRERLMRFASWIEGGSGLTTAVRILTGDSVRTHEQRLEAESELAREVRGLGLDAFARVVVAPDPESGFPVLLQAAGIGPIRANTILLNWFDQERQASDAPGMAAFGRYLRTAVRRGCNVILLEATRAEVLALDGLRPRDRRIDVWWQGDASSRLALMLAYLMTRTEDWSGAGIRLVQAVPAGEDAEAARASLEQLLDDVRIEALPLVLPGADRGDRIAATADATLVFVPFRIRGEEPLDVAGEPFDRTLEALPMVALVLAAQDIDLDSQPDEGPQAEAAQASDLAARAEKLAESMDEEAREASRAHEQLRASLAEALDRRAGSETIEQLRRSLEEAGERAERLRRRAAKAQVKARDAADEAAALGDEA